MKELPVPTFVTAGALRHGIYMSLARRERGLCRQQERCLVQLVNTSWRTMFMQVYVFQSASAELLDVSIVLRLSRWMECFEATKQPLHSRV